MERSQKIVSITTSTATTKIDAITEMEVEVEEDAQSCHSDPHYTAAPKTTESRRLPPIILGGHNDWESLVKMTKDEMINFTRARRTRDGIKIFADPLSYYNWLKISFVKTTESTTATNYLTKGNVVLSSWTLREFEREENNGRLDKLKIAAKVFPITSKRANAELSLYVIKTENSAIYKEDKLLELVAKIEAKGR